MNKRRVDPGIELRAKSKRRRTKSEVYVFCVLLVALSFLLYALSLEAAVTGNCVNCHTMHNSQDNLPMANRVFSGGSVTTSETPQSHLLRGNCIGCHSDNLNNSILTLDSVKYPIVYSIGGDPSNPLAGGNFRTVVITGNVYGHNVAGIASADTLSTPPGFVVATKPSAFTPTGSVWGPSSWTGHQVTCAGEYGCHGARFPEYDDYAGVKGGHHGNKSSFADLDGKTVGKSYRFLAGIRGAEESLWEQMNSSTRHNGYYGVTTYGGETDTISYLCGECHGNFHASGQVGSSSPWLRHPADFAFSGVRNGMNGGYTNSEYAFYNSPDTNKYSTLAPVAETSPSTNSETVGSGSIVMCLSCHRAHASLNFKIMRWNYKSSTLSEALSGCNVCHTLKN